MGAIKTQADAAWADGSAVDKSDARGVFTQVDTYVEDLRSRMTTAESDISTAEASIGTLQTTTAGLESDISGVESDLTQEVTDRQNAVAAEASTRASAISAEATARSNAISAEASARASAISAEATARANADSAEANTRALADAAETTARIEGDDTLSDRIDGLPTIAEVIGSQARPGDCPRFFASSTSGTPALTSASTEVTQDGRAAIITGAGVVSPVGTYAIEPLRRYGIRFVVRRLIDTEDPAGDAIRFAIQWMRKDGTVHSTTTLANILDVTIASGRLDYPYVIGTVTADDLDASAPAAAVYLRPFVQVFGSGKTSVEVIEVTDLTQGVDVSPDVADYRREVASLSQAVASYASRLDGVDDLVADARDAAWITAGTLADARLSDNVMLLDEDQLVTSVKTHTEPLRIRDILYIGDTRAYGGGATAKIIGDVNYVAIQPTDLDGGHETLRELGFNADLTDPNGNVWTAEGGFKTTGDLTVTADGSFGGDLAVTGTAAVTGAATFGSSVAITGTLGVDDDVTLDSDLSVGGNADITGTLDVTDAVTLSDALDVTGASTFAATVEVGGNATLDADLSVGGDATVTGTLGVTDNTTLSADLSVGGNADITGTLDVTGIATLASDVSVGGDAEIAGTLDVTGVATFADDAAVGGDLSVTGNGAVTGTFGVTADATFSANVQVDGDLAVDGDVTLVGGTIDGVAVTNVPAPVDAGDAATKGYVDTVAQGLDPKASVRAATTGDITLSGEQTIDGVSVVADDRVLVKEQTAPEENGIYIAATGAWSRAPDFDNWAEVPGAYVWVEEGSTLGDTAWNSTADAGGTLGTTAITWSQFAGVGTYTAGTGLSLTGREFAISDAELLAIAGLTSAADRLPYFTGAGTASLATFTAFGRSLVDDADAATARGTLELGTIATQDANSVAITGGSIAGITDLAIADGGTGASSAGAARTNLGLGTIAIQDADSVAITGGTISGVTVAVPQADISTDENFTLTVGSSAEQIRHTGTLTADRTITLATAGATAGARFRVTRTGSGAFNLDLGGLKNLATDTWADAVFDGTAWYLAAYGTL